MIQGEQNKMMQTPKSSKKERKAAKRAAKNNPNISEPTINRLLKTIYPDNKDVVQGLDLGDPKSILDHLVPALMTLVDKIVKLESSIAEKEENPPKNQPLHADLGDLQQRVRAQEDELDEARQRELKGNIIISSPAKGGQPSLIKNDSELQEQKKSLIDHANDLLHKKYGLTIPPEDFIACHRLKNNIFMKIFNRKEGSAWAKLMPLIKSTPMNNTNVYVNFQMTRRRSEMMYFIRQKRDIFKQNNKPFKVQWKCIK